MNSYTFCIIGTMENGNFPNSQIDLAESIHWLTADYGIIWSDGNGRNCCWRHLIEQFIGASYTNCNPELIAKLEKSELVNNMSNFPETNSVRIVDDIVVIKLSD